MNKKAVSTAFIVATILILLFTFVLLIFIGTFFQKTEQAAVEEKCRISVEREAMINSLLEPEGAGNTLNDFAGNVECQTVPVDLRGKEEKTIAATAKTLMEKCWNTFGKGGLKLFSRGEGTFCHICYSLTIDPNIRVDLGSTQYDVQSPLAGENHGIVFFYNRDTKGAITSKIYVRPLNALDMCKDAEFPRQRL